MQQRNSVQNFLTWLNQNSLWVLSGFLLVFIPLYPKIPLFSLLADYIVRVRVEDILVAVVVGWWLIQLLRQKISLKTPLTKPIFIYLGVGILSLVSAMLVVKSIPLEPLHLGKSLLHLLRYIEYFLLYFLFFSAYKSFSSKQKPVVFLTMLVIVLLVLVSYGVGQKYYRWPAFSTMNREYSSGVALVLAGQNARLQATFAGHYDLGAYLVILLPLMLSSFYFFRRRDFKVVFGGALVSGLWLLVITASRSSFIGIFLAVTVVTGVAAWLERSDWLGRVKWMIGRLAALYALIGIILILFGTNITLLFLHAIGGNSIVARVFPGYSQSGAVIKQHALPKPKDQLDIPIATSSGVTPHFSECTSQYGLSLCIRFDSLWPQAWQSFRRSPWLGTGYATLNKQSFDDFTEVDGTDNNYLRVLGETGVAGFLAFFGMIFYANWLVIKSVASGRKNGQFTKTGQAALAVGYLGVSTGLLINAVLIDVFVSSKVAYTFWAVTGVVLAEVSDSSFGKHKLRLSKVVWPQRIIVMTLIFVLITVGVAWLSWRFLSPPISSIQM